MFRLSLVFAGISVMMLISTFVQTFGVKFGSFV